MIDNKYIDELALHRNEITKEMDGEDIIMVESPKKAKLSWTQAANAARKKNALSQSNAIYQDDSALAMSPQDN